MQLENRTRYSSKQLSSLIRAVYRRGARKHGPLRRWPQTIIYASYARKPSDYRAYANVGGYKIWLHLPRRRASVAMMTYVIAHEIMHLYGHDHDDNKFPWQWPTNFKPWRWTVATYGQTLRKEPRGR